MTIQSRATRMKFAPALFIALAVGATPIAAFAQDASSGPEIRSLIMNRIEQSDAPLIAFAITEEIKSAPDRASIGTGVQTSAPTAVEAMRLNAAAMDRLVRALRSNGIAERDIQTSGISLSPQYDYSPQQQGQPPRLTGYQVSNQVRVVTADIAHLGGLLDTLVAAGGTNLDGPNFYVENPDAALDTARAHAMERANARAMLYARAAGYTRARLVSLSEGGAPNPQPVPMMAMARMAADSAAPTPVQPGQVGNSVSINVQYRLER
jgi:hypothetical protein